MAEQHNALGSGWSNWPEMLGKARNLNAEGAVTRGGEATPGLRSREQHDAMLLDLLEDVRTLLFLVTDGAIVDKMSWIIHDLADSFEYFENNT